MVNISNQTKRMNSWKKYIFWFAQEHVDFRNSEILSIAKLFNLSYNKICKDSLKPFWVVELPNEETALKIASRSVSLRCILEYWAHSTSAEGLKDDICKYIGNSHNNAQQYFQPHCNFKITVETYNKHFSQHQKIEKIESFDYLPVQSDVNLKNPEVEWWYIEFWGLDPQNVPDHAEDLLFGRLVATGQRRLIKELSLKSRKFIGHTSMESQLSLLMANQALVKKGDIVFDPFVGSGSLLVSAAKFGGYVLGADIDYMMLHAKCRPSRITQKVREKDESIFANLKQYGCEKQYLDVVVADFSSPIWKDTIRFDSIITDPPYGIREATEKVETKVSKKANKRSDTMPHYPSTSHYSLQHLYADLLTFAAKHLDIGGRLVCWIPFHRNDYTEQLLPKHGNLLMVANSEQPLSSIISRRLLTYEKISEPANDTSVQADVTDFRRRYFDNGLESRSERRIRKAEMRIIGRQEALARSSELSRATLNEEPYHTANKTP